MLAPSKLPETLNKGEVKRLLEVPNKGCQSGLRNYCIIWTLYRAGLRASELVNLAPKDVDLDNGVIHVWRGKGAKDRKVYIDEETENVLRMWISERPKGSRYFFCTLKGGKLDTSYLRHTLARYGEKADIPKRVHPHMLRHTYATELLKEGYNIMQVKKLLGHSDVSTTMVYTHVWDGELANDIRHRKPVLNGGENNE